MSLILRPVTEEEYETVVEVLRDAETGEERLRRLLVQPEHTSYLACVGGEIVGGATLKWQKDESELIYIATVPQVRGRGYGKAIITIILRELFRRGGRSLLVGTGNSSLDNLAFYQKCGFRMDHVRQNYFDYIKPPIWENGIRLQDMLVFRYICATEAAEVMRE